MSRSLLFALSLFGMVASSAAQTAVITRVQTNPTGNRFFVDGEPYRSAQTFVWPTGSKHTLYIERDQNLYPGMRSHFNSWTDNTGKLSWSGDTVTVTADPSISGYTATYTQEILLKVVFYQCENTPGNNCRPPGTVSVGGAQTDRDVEQWVSVNSVVVLNAFPNPGFIFNGWGPPSGNSTAPIISYTMRGPTTFSNIFAAAKPVTLTTDPPNFMVAPDRTPTRSPVVMDWGVGSKHVLGVVSPQNDLYDTSKTYVFKQWSNGAANYDTYTLANNTTPETLTASFVRGVGVSFVTVPSGLKLRVDGRDNWPAYNFIWGVGMKYNVSAAADQVDSRGRRYVFKGWSNGGPAAQDVTITDEMVAAGGFRLIATYEAQNRLTINSNPPGMPLMVDGKECQGSCTVDKPAGSKIMISATPSVPIADASRFEFLNWSDGGSATRSYTFTDAAQTNLVANYKTFYRLVASSEPGNGAQFRFDPPTVDGFYAADSNVAVTADTMPGYRFRRWDGDLAGSFRSGSVVMTVPRAVRAFLDITPWVEDSGVRNSAGETPENLVAPGSIGSVFGANLAGAYEAGPGNPLSQTIGNVTVRLDSQLLPLVFVSPQQINLQVPSTLAEGLYQVSVKWGNYPEVLAPMHVVRNAPGLFQKKVDEIMLAAALHEDGSEINMQAKAQKGETITVFGTGFGPSERPQIDGFPAPAEPVNALLDTVEAYLGDTQLEIVWSGVAAGQVGANLVRLKIPADAAGVDGGTALRIRVNGRDSNTVFLAVE